MKRQRFKKIQPPHLLQALLVSIGVGIIGLSVLFISFAATPPTKLYLKPAAKSININTSFTVDVLVQADKQVNYARAYLDFPAAKLQVTSVSASGSDFASQGEQTYNNTAGQVKITRYSSTQKTGSLLVARVTFQTKQNGSAAVTFNSSSRLTNGGAYGGYYPDLATSKDGGTYTITTPSNPAPPATPPPPSSTSGGSSTTTTTTTTTPRTTPAPQTTATPGGANTPATAPDTAVASDGEAETIDPPTTSDTALENSMYMPGSSSGGSRTGAIIAGVGVLTGVGVIGAAFMLKRRGPALSLPAQHDLTTEQVEAEMNSSLLPRGSETETMPDAAEQPPTPQPDDAEMLVPPPVVEQPPTAPEPSPPDTSDLQEDEPKDMFDIAEEQFHYDEKFKTPKK